MPIYSEVLFRCLIEQAPLPPLPTGTVGGGIEFYAFQLGDSTKGVLVVMPLGLDHFRLYPYIGQPKRAVTVYPDGVDPPDAVEKVYECLKANHMWNPNA